ncbi:MAG TPA: alpha-E domain-containing protein [Solirubrobacteraceae bacterium]|nr:alpha-E domain-containing protein [Solirubrobacteraceae bacterium]
MLARIAQELFWLGRDLNRAENTARMLDGAFHADVAGAPNERGIALSWAGVLAIIGAKPPAPGEEAGAEREPAEAAAAAVEAAADGWVGGGWAPLLGRAEVAPLLTLDTDSPASIVSCVARARDRGRTLRDVISTEMWEALNAFYLSLGRYDLQAALLTGPYSVYQEVKERCAQLWGLVDRTMLRDEGRAFLEAGGRIEEADMVLRMLRVTVPAEAERNGEFGHDAEALALLQATGGVQAYRRAVRQTPTLRSVTRFLLYEGAYPGSVASSLEALRTALETADAQPRSSPPVLRLGRLIADLELQRRTPGQTDLVGEMLAQIQDELELIDRDVDDRYFAIAALSAVHL